MGAQISASGRIRDCGRNAQLQGAYFTRRRTRRWQRKGCRAVIAGRCATSIGRTCVRLGGKTGSYLVGPTIALDRMSDPAGDLEHSPCNPSERTKASSDGGRVNR